ncbi:MAG: DUF222 domain-containing protein [Actinomycetes bacterium]
MSTGASGPLEAARVAVEVALADLRDAAATVGGQGQLGQLTFLHQVIRQAEHDSAHTVARLLAGGVFAEVGSHPAPGVADLLRCGLMPARVLVRVAGRVFGTTSVLGEPLPAVLPATGDAWKVHAIDRAHVEVIDQALSSRAAAGLDPGRWAGAEEQLAEQARTMAPDELASFARELIDALDEDGPEPDYDSDAQVNELFLAASPDGAGGRVKGQLDSVTFDALRQAIDGVIKPEADEAKSLGQRQADAVGELCEHVLDDGRLPEVAGEKPHLSITLGYDRLRKQLRGGSLHATGLRIGPKEIRRIACDSLVIALVLSGQNEPLDVGRDKRTVTKYQRRALIARDGGCAHPGCTRPPSWCSAHHITHWVDGGLTALDNLVLLCLVHHRMIHHSGWQVTMRDHLPEFVPPKWADIHQTPRRRQFLQCA